MGSCFVECWKCDVCGHSWIKTEVWPETCAKKACRSRKWNKNAAKPAADSKGELKPVAEPEAQTVLMSGSVEDRKAAVLASLGGLGVTTAAAAEERPGLLQATVSTPAVAQVERMPCPYTEPDMESGDVFACALHTGHKGKHVRGAKVGDIFT